MKKTRRTAGLVRRSSNRKGSEGGFTLVEMMVVIVIIGILAAVLIMQISGRADRAKVEATKAMIAQVSQALDMFKLDQNRYPIRLDDLMTQPSDVAPNKWPPGGYLKKFPRDGWDREFIYRIPGTKGQPFDVVSLGEDGREGGEGYAEDLWNHEAYKR
jgi:general secretion pathway protein G